MVSRSVWLRQDKIEAIVSRKKELLASLQAQLTSLHALNRSR